jgi:hypothetical protein
MKKERFDRWRSGVVIVTCSALVAIAVASPSSRQGAERSRLLIRGNGFTLVQEGSRLIVLRGHARQILDQGADPLPVPQVSKSAGHWIVRYTAMEESWKVLCLDESGRGRWTVTRDAVSGVPPTVRASSRWALVGPTESPRFTSLYKRPTERERQAQYRLFRHSWRTALVSMRDGRRVWERTTEDVGLPLHVDGDRVWAVRVVNPAAVWVSGTPAEVRLELRRLPDMHLLRAWLAPMGVPKPDSAYGNAWRLNWTEPRVSRPKAGVVRLKFVEPVLDWHSDVTLSLDGPSINLNGQRIALRRLRRTKR